jgi:hypothetical protein
MDGRLKSPVHGIPAKANSCASKRCVRGTTAGSTILTTNCQRLSGRREMVFKPIPERREAHEKAIKESFKSWHSKKVTA